MLRTTTPHQRIQRPYRIIRLMIVLVFLYACSRQTPVPPSMTPAPLSPVQLLERADEQQTVGEYEQAAGDYQQVINQYPETPEARIARFGLAHSAFMRQDWAAARSLLENFIATGGDDEWYQRAVFLLARVTETLGDHHAAIAAYERYETTTGPLIGYAKIRRAAQLRQLNRLGEAAAAFEAGGFEPIAANQRVAAYEAAIEIHDAAGSSDASLNDVAAMLEFARLATFRPHLLADGASRALELGDPNRAIPWLQELVNDWGGAPQALDAVDTLQSLGIPTPAFREGQLAFNHNSWERAISAFDAALAAGLAPEQQGEARRKRALAIRELGDFSTAQAELEALANEQPDTPLGRQSRLDAIQTYGQAGDRAGAIELYRQFAAMYPDDPLAPEALRRVAEIISWNGDPEATFTSQMALGERYPWSSEGQEALHTAALQAYGAGDFQRALEVWKLLGDRNLGQPQARGYYWAGRMAINLGDQDEGRRLLNAAYTAAPNSYYAARVADMLGLTDSANLPFGAEISPEAQQTGSDWIATWATPSTTQLDVTAYQHRATELVFVDLPSEAQAEWVAARDVAATDPHLLYQVALAAYRSHTPYASVTTARQLMELAPVEAGEPPPAIRQLLYPTPYATAVIANSQAFEVDPRLVYALMRQESIFNPDATSWVGARGLAQVMPETGAGIAQNLGVEGFEPDDLYQPVLSIRFGSFYIGEQVARMNGSVHGGLAAYNGGPGNAERWANGNTIADPDIFLLSIDFPETSHYVEVVYANYGAYRRLYKW